LHKAQHADLPDARKILRLSTETHCDIGFPAPKAQRLIIRDQFQCNSRCRAPKSSSDGARMRVSMQPTLVIRTWPRNSAVARFNAASMLAASSAISRKRP
jgi:hypothetical protein